MAFSELERKRCETALAAFLEDKRPPPAVRHQVDLLARIEGQSVVIYQARPHWRDPTQTMEVPVAKSTFVRSHNRWRIYWMRQDLKWHSYQPCPEVRSVEEFFKVVARDDCNCFFR